MPFDIIDPGYPCLHTGSFSDGPAINDKFVVVSCCNLQPRLRRCHPKKHLLSEISYRSNLGRFDPLGITEVQLILALLRAKVRLLYIITAHDHRRVREVRCLNEVDTICMSYSPASRLIAQ